MLFVGEPADSLSGVKLQKSNDGRRDEVNCNLSRVKLTLTLVLRETEAVCGVGLPQFVSLRVC